MRILRSANTPFFLLHLLGSQIRAEMAAGYEVYAAAGPGDGYEELSALLGGRLVEVPIARDMAPLADLVSLWRLYRLMRRLRPDIAHSTTPKPGLLFAIAGFLARVPIRMHTFTGQPWVEMRGARRLITRACDRLIMVLNTANYCDSPSQQAFLESEGIGRVGVVGAGSLSGVDTEKFSPPSAEQRRAARAAFNLPDEARVIAFVGRITADKGMVELMDAFDRLKADVADLHLVLIGPFDDRAPLPAAELRRIHAAPGVHALGYVPQPEKVLAAADVLALASYREGFGNVVIEAAAMGIPTVGTRINGLIDAVADGESGLLVPVKDAAALAHALGRVLVDDTLRLALGRAARARAARLFDADRISALVLEEYRRLARGRLPI
ncbi:MAG TPA: glycosyltransferase [Burkholderiales bacterium]|nr:glycosyltransferase [Burkholderiales bacterium]